jgi:DNA invertase Pin-like site-specific DNA recombinase
MNKLFVYYRVSTQRKGESGLGLEGQETAVLAFAKATDATIVGRFVEVESGRKSDRPELKRAFDHAKMAHATLCIAKLDRLARNVAFLSGLMEAGTPFVCCDNPHATPLTIHILAAVAEDEAQRTSARTKAALAAYKAGKHVSRRIRAQYPSGVPAQVIRETAGKLGAALPQCRNLTVNGRHVGSERAAEARRAGAAARADRLLPLVRQLRSQGVTLQAIADHLNGLGFVTGRGGPWHHVAVLRLLRPRQA